MPEPRTENAQLRNGVGPGGRPGPSRPSGHPRAGMVAHPGVDTGPARSFPHSARIMPSEARPAATLRYSPGMTNTKEGA